MHLLGQWAWVQDLCGLPLAEAHCRLFRILLDGTCQDACCRGCDQILVSCTTKPSASATSAIKTCNHVSAMLLEIRPSSKPLPIKNPRIATSAYTMPNTQKYIRAAAVLVKPVISATAPESKCTMLCTAFTCKMPSR